MPINQANQENQAWARWDYAPDEWAQLDRMDWRPTALRHWLAVGITGPGSLLALAFFLWFVVTDAGAISGFALFIMLFLFLLLMLYAQFFWKVYDKAKKRHQARQNPSHPQRVTLSGQGIWEAGTHFPFGGSGVETNEFGVKLLEVQMTSQPTTLHFRVEYRSLYRSDRGTRSQRTQETIYLLVPRGHESEAEPVAQRLRTEVIEARERAEKRAQEARVNPSEPS